MKLCERKGVVCECLTDHSTCNSDNCHRKLSDIEFTLEEVRHSLEKVGIELVDGELNIEKPKFFEGTKRLVEESTICQWCFEEPTIEGSCFCQACIDSFNREDEERKDFDLDKFLEEAVKKEDANIYEDKSKK